MADKRISILPALASAAREDVLLVVDDPAGAPTNKKITIQSFFSNVASEVVLANTKAAANSTDGALVVKGGAGFLQNVYIDGSLSVAGSITLDTVLTDEFASSIIPNSLNYTLGNVSSYWKELYTKEIFSGSGTLTISSNTTITANTIFSQNVDINGDLVNIKGNTYLDSNLFIKTTSVNTYIGSSTLYVDSDVFLMGDNLQINADLDLTNGLFISGPTLNVQTESFQSNANSYIVFSNVQIGEFVSEGNPKGVDTNYFRVKASNSSFYSNNNFFGTKSEFTSNVKVISANVDIAATNTYITSNTTIERNVLTIKSNTTFTGAFSNLNISTTNTFISSNTVINNALTNFFGGNVNFNDTQVSATANVELLGSNTYINGTLFSVLSNVSLLSDYTSTTPTSGSLVLAGGLGVGKDVNIGEDLTVGGNLHTVGNITFDGEITLSGVETDFNATTVNFTGDVTSLTSNVSFTGANTYIAGTTFQVLSNVVFDSTISNTWISGADISILANAHLSGANTYVNGDTLEILSNVFFNSAISNTWIEGELVTVVANTTFSGADSKVSFVSNVDISSANTWLSGDLVTVESNTTFSGADATVTIASNTYVTSANAWIDGTNLKVKSNVDIESADVSISSNTNITSTTTSTSSTTGALIVDGGVGIAENLNVGGNIHATGNITADGNINIGNESTDTVSITASLSSSIIPDTDNSYDLGSDIIRYQNVYSHNITANAVIVEETLTASAINVSGITTATQNVYLNGTDVYLKFSDDSHLRRSAVGTLSLTSNEMVFSSNVDLNGSNTNITSANTLISSTGLNIFGTDLDISSNATASANMTFTGANVYINSTQLDIASDINITSTNTYIAGTKTTLISDVHVDSTVSNTYIEGTLLTVVANSLFSGADSIVSIVSNVDVTSVNTYINGTSLEVLSNAYFNSAMANAWIESQNLTIASNTNFSGADAIVTIASNVDISAANTYLSSSSIVFDGGASSNTWIAGENLGVTSNATFQSNFTLTGENFHIGDASTSPDLKLINTNVTKLHYDPISDDFHFYSPIGVEGDINVNYAVRLHDQGQINFGGYMSLEDGTGSFLIETTAGEDKLGLQEQSQDRIKGRELGMEFHSLNFGFGDVNFNTGSRNNIILGIGQEPQDLPVDTQVYIWAEMAQHTGSDEDEPEVGHLYIMDGGGNKTRFSPHDENNEWVFYSENKKTGKKIKINMESMIRKLEEFTGEKFIEEG